ncbi:nuclear transport factor 2 family protein [Nocardia sp. NPDC004123]
MNESTPRHSISDTVGQLLEHLSKGALEQALALADDNVVMSIPFQPPGYVTRIEGKSELRAFLARVLDLFSPFELHLTETFLSDTDESVVAHYYSDATVARTGKPYENTYLAIFRFADGLLTEWTEFANPLVVLKSFEVTDVEPS